MDGRRLARRIIEPRPGTTRRIPMGLARGLRFAAEPAETASADLWLGLFESELASHVRRLCRPGSAAVDVGANSGFYALVLARRSGATVYAYEPDPVPRARLERNLRLNPDVAGRVDVRPVAVTDVASADSITLSGDLAGAGDIGLIKIDVDGGEDRVLEGARELLLTQRPNVIVETHSPGLEAGCAAFLREAGYRPIVVTPRRLLPQNRPAEHNRWLVAEGAGAVR